MYQCFCQATNTFFSRLGICYLLAPGKLGLITVIAVSYYKFGILHYAI